MSITRRLAIGLAAAGALATAGAPVASAHDTPSVKGVSAHAKSAQKSMKRVTKAVNRHQSSAARRHLAAARRQAALASREARALHAAADTTGELTAAAGALGLATDTYTDLLTMISTVIDQVRGVVQDVLAAAILPSVNGQTRLLEILNGLVAHLPEAYQDEAAALVAQLTAATTDPLGALTGLLGEEGLPFDVASIVSTALQTATAAVQTALGGIEKIIPSLPAMAQQPLRMALTLVTDVIGTVTETLASFLSPASRGATQSGGLLGSLISGPLGMVQNLLGGFLGREGLFGGLLGGGGLFGRLPARA